MNQTQQLTESLSSDDAVARIEAAQRLATLGEDAQPAAVALVEALDRDDDELQEWSVAALEQLGPPNVSDIPALTQLLQRGGELTGYWVCTLLGRLAEQARPAVQNLARTLQTSHDLAVQQRAAWALGQIGSSDGESVQALQAAASSADARLGASPNNRSAPWVTIPKREFVRQSARPVIPDTLRPLVVSPYCDD